MAVILFLSGLTLLIILDRLFAATFSFGGNIYSFGGYGFWKTNGLLRTFNSYSREWDVQKLDREIPCNFHAGSGFFLDTLHKALYILGPLPETKACCRIQYFRQRPVGRISFLNRKLFFLDIETGTWKELSSYYSYNSDLSQCPWGMWNIGKYDVTYVLNIDENKMYRSTSEFSKKASKIFDRENDVWFFIDSTLYVGNIEQNTLDTLSISLKDFEYSGPAFHSPSKLLSWSKSKALWALTTAGLILLFFLVYSRFYKKENRISTSLWVLRERHRGTYFH